MIRCEVTPTPTGTTQTVTTNETDFANALYFVASQAGYEITLEALDNNHSQLEFRGDDEDVTHLFQAAYNQQDVWFWRKMGGYDLNDQVVKECEMAMAA